MVDTNFDTKVRLRADVTGAVRRRRWSDDEKGRIVSDAIAPGAVIAAVARRHDLTPQQLSNWIRAAKDGDFVLPADVAFVPAVVEAPEPRPAAVPRGSIGSDPQSVQTGHPSIIASLLADSAYPKTPIIRSELIQRDRPSSNAMAAVRDLAHAMVERPHLENLGFVGFPAELGLYLTAIRPFGLHRRGANEAFGFFEPDRIVAGKSIRPVFDVLFQARDITLRDLYLTWSKRP